MSTSTWTSAVWATEQFRAELCAFLTAAVGFPERVEVVALRPWSALWRVTAGGRTSYAKQNCPGQAHEARLMARLARVAPDRVVPVLAADPDRDLLLTADLGPTVHDRGGAADPATWARIAADAADLQRRLVGAVDDLRLSVLAPADSTTYVADAVGRLAALAPDDPRRLAPEVAVLLEALLPTVERWSDRVEDLDLPLTLLHNDLHAENVVLAPDGGLRFFDFGDALVGDPLAGLYVPLAMARESLGLPPDDPALWRIADAALEVWSDLAAPADLRAALPAALQLGRLARVESWRRCVATMTPDERREFGSAPAVRLASLLDPPPLGGSAALG
ncbi:aminoglycoside phosphotransferase family protein [Nocardioides sp. QY071]|uniref:aminoglycoside phosphotransferase family protein n=1 Tax=Nocardioides sp. QY071 TaxID=3044187 RepID=UPI00249BBC8A|nr:aminoglycoside phosphotransferase family protein [Nocardioides sp. QY071]WGY04000.1 aminoglycoside phosphotransferase family protein [Nocardioides sp. QY071]